MLTLSDYYRQDVEEGTIMVPEYPTSCKQHLNSDRFLVNHHMYRIDDETKPPNALYYKILIPTRIAMVCGSHLRLFMEKSPDAALMEHWARKLGREVPIKMANFGENCPHIVQFPLEKLPRNLQTVDPDHYYDIHSKAFIPEIPCSQAKVLTNPTAPCVVKLARASGGKSTWMVKTQKELEEVQDWIADNCPTSEVIYNEMVTDVVANVCVQFYVNKKGKMQWIGAGEQLDDEDGMWCGSLYHRNLQSKWKQALKKTILPVAEALHKKGYFGVVGVDVLVKKDGTQYVIDINPRVNGSTPFLLTTKYKSLKKHDVAVFRNDIKVNTSLEDFIDLIENKIISDCDIVIFCAAQKDSTWICQVAAYGKSVDECERILASLKNGGKGF